MTNFNNIHIDYFQPPQILIIYIFNIINFYSLAFAYNNQSVLNTEHNKLYSSVYKEINTSIKVE